MRRSGSCRGRRSGGLRGCSSWRQFVPSEGSLKECVQECVSEFISFITSEAAEKCQMEKRKTIGGEDILYAMVTLGFENYAETLKIHLAKLRQVCVFAFL